MSDPQPQVQRRAWEVGWEQHSLEQLRRLARLPFPEKLRWLEQAHRLVMQMQAAREKQQFASEERTDP